MTKLQTRCLLTQPQLKLELVEARVCLNICTLLPQQVDQVKPRNKDSVQLSSNLLLDNRSEFFHHQPLTSFLEPRVLSDG